MAITTPKFEANDKVLVLYGPNKGRVGIVTAVTTSEWTGLPIVYVWFEGADGDAMELPEALEKLANMTGWISGSCGL